MHLPIAYNYGLCAHCHLPLCGHADNGTCPASFESLRDDRKQSVRAWGLMTKPARTIYHAAKELDRKGKSLARKNRVSPEYAEACWLLVSAARTVLEAAVVDADERTLSVVPPAE